MSEKGQQDHNETSHSSILESMGGSHQRSPLTMMVYKVCLQF